MSFSEYDGGPGGGGARRPERLSAEQIDAWEFPRAGLTHRGYDEEGVLRFKRRVLAELQAAAQIEAELRQRNDELTNQLRTSYAGNDPANGGAAAAPPLAGSLPAYEVRSWTVSSLLRCRSSASICAAACSSPRTRRLKRRTPSSS